jgi:ammonia channel protein AmtB
MILKFEIGYLLFNILRKTVGLRVPVSEENTGIDVCEHGLPCYPGFS